MGLVAYCFGSFAEKHKGNALHNESFRFYNTCDDRQEDQMVMGSRSLVQEARAWDPESRIKRLPQYNKKPISTKYHLGEIIGVGGFSVVRLLTKKATRQEFACKIMKIPKRKDEGGLDCMSREAMFNELDLACRVHSPHITSVEEIFITRSKIYIVFELMRGGILLDNMASQPYQRYTEEDARGIFHQILEGVSYLHARSIAHRDLKLQNLMLVNENDLSHVKIIDMGLAKQIVCVTNTSCGSPLFVAPEILSRSGCGHGLAVDMWSAGVILYLMLGGYSPFYGDDEYALFANIENCNYNFEKPIWNRISQSAKNLITQCLQLDPVQRITVTQALNHPWFSGGQHDESSKLILYLDPASKGHCNESMEFSPRDTDSEMEQSSSSAPLSYASLSENPHTFETILDVNYSLIQRYITYT